MAGSMCAAVTSAVSGSTSTKHGRAPTSVTASAVAMNELAGTITSSPGPIRSARSASARASVPEATPTAKRVPHASANSRSKLSTSSPRVKAADEATRSTVASSSSMSAGSALSMRVMGTLATGAVIAIALGRFDLAAACGHHRMVRRRRGGRRIEEAAQLRDPACLGPVVHVELAIDVRQVELDRLLGHPQHAGQLGVGVALGDVTQQLELARGQAERVTRRPRSCHRTTVRDGGQVHRVLEGLVDRVEQVGGRSRLDDVRVGAGGEGEVDALAVVIG